MRRPVPCELVVIGASRGGLRALEAVLGALPAGFGPPVAIVQHRDKTAPETLAELLQRRSPRPVVEAEDKQPIRPGHVYLAPADYHLLVDAGHFALSTEPPVHHARPSVDVLFESAAEAYRERVTGVVLTGASTDGAEGLAAIKRHGGLTVAQDPATAEAPAMPEAAIAAGAADHVLPLAEIGPFLVARAGGPPA